MMDVIFVTDFGYKVLFNGFHKYNLSNFILHFVQSDGDIKEF